MSHHINHGVNAQQNNLAEIQETAKLAGQKVQQISVQERQVVAQEKSHAAPPSKAQTSSFSSVSTTDKNLVDVAGDMLTAKMGMPSIELASMACDIIGDRGSLFNCIKTGFEGKSNGYGRGSKSKSTSIKTAHFNDIAGRAECVCDFTSSGVKGVKAAKSSAPNLQIEKQLVCSQKMAAEKTHGLALHAERQVQAKIGNAMRIGAPPALVASLKSGPKFVSPDEALRKSEDNNIWGSGTATT